MKTNPENISQKLKNVPVEKRVWIYNADIIIEFLNSTFMPTKFFLKNEGMSVAPGKQLVFEDFNPGAFEAETVRITMTDLYKYYLMFRQNKDYTSEIETKFKFQVIIKKLRYYKNGWEFIVTRFTRNQILIVYPALLRIKATSEDRAKYPVSREQDVVSAQVDVAFNDLQEEESEKKFVNIVEKEMEKAEPIVIKAEEDY